MRHPFRTDEGGLIDRDTLVRFDFDGHRFSGCAGDSLASALLANGVRLVGRSFKYHRPRGIVGLGSEEPNALVRIGTDDRREPNVKATEVELYEGLVAESQNRWPTLAFDAGAVADKLSALLPAGFYYKTFMRPAGWWMRYERRIRRMAGLGIAPVDPDPDRYAKRHAHCEVLVVGGGPAGLSAALAAAATGARVILADEGARFGGGLLHAPAEIDGAPAAEWVEAAVSALAALDNVTLLPRSTVAGHYDHGLLTIAERVTDHMAAPPDRLPRQRLWMVRARRVVLASGAIERPLVFADNDRPGVMMASAVRGYLHRYGVLCGRRALLFTDNDTAYPLALELAAAGTDVAAIVDLRERLDGNLGGEAGEAVRAAGIQVLANRTVARVRTRRSVAGVEVRRIRVEGDSLSAVADKFGCDLVAMSGGWNPALHLFAQGGGRTRFDDALAAFVPDGVTAVCTPVGACAGALDLDRALADGAAAGSAAAAASGHRADAVFAVPRGGPQPSPRSAGPPRALPAAGRAKRFVDFQNDVTADDVALAAREGYRSIEHVKRYTTLGMGTDQGKLGNPTGAALLARALGRPVGETGTTTARPPYTPVTIGALAAGAVDEAGHPVRRTAVDDWHAGRHTVFVPAGLWRRPLHYPVAGQSALAAVDAEATAVREGVGLVDVATLGKLDIKGVDAAELLDRIYVNGWKTLEIGRGRYGVMLRDDGRVFDDGVTMRLGEHHFLMSTTTARAEAVFEHIEFLLQTAWRDLRVFVTPVTEHWFACAIAGPRARALLFDLTDEIDVSDESFPMMSVREGRIAGIAARILRLSYSGELSYELHVPADYGLCLWNAVLAAGGRHGLAVYGTDAMSTLRIEKGHITHAEADGRTTPDDLGLGRMVSRRKDFVGRRALDLPALAEPGRLQLVGLVALDPATPFPEGAQIVPEPWEGRPQTTLGHVTSHCHSPTLGTYIGLALLRDGRARHDTELWAVSPLAGTGVRCRVTAPVFYDPEGTRADG